MYPTDPFIRRAVTRIYWARYCHLAWLPVADAFQKQLRNKALFSTWNMLLSLGVSAETLRAALQRRIND